MAGRFRINTTFLENHPLASVRRRVSGPRRAKTEPRPFRPAVRQAIGPELQTPPAGGGWSVVVVVVVAVWFAPGVTWQPCLRLP